MNLKSNLRIITTAFLLTINLHSQGNDFQFTHITSEDGLSVNGVTKILQDSKGFLWFGTYNGLHRYDGYNFKIFLPEPSNPKSISSHSILSLYEDFTGDIWVGTADGLNKFDWKTEQFHRYKNNPEDLHSLSYNHVYSVFEDKSRTLWVGTLEGLNKYNREKDNFTVLENIYIDLDGRASNSVTCINEDNKGNIWLGTWNGIINIQKDGKLIRHFLSDEKNHRTIGHREISVIYEDNSDNVWIGTNGKGLEMYNPKTGIFTRYRTKPNNPNSISNDYVNTIYQDKLNTLWIGTKNGLNKFDSKENKFTRIFHDQLVSYSLINNDVLSIAEDKTGIIWIGTAGGISKLHLATNNFMSYQKNSRNPRKSLSDERVNNFYMDSRDNLWICTKAGLDKISAEGKKITHYNNNPLNKNSLSYNYVKTVIEDHRGIIWIGTDGGGLNRYNPETDKYKIYRYNTDNPNSISNDGITSIYEDRNNNLWVGTYWGLNRFDRKTEKFFWYLAEPPKPNALLNNLIWVIYEDSKGMIWLGTDGGGVSMFNPKTEIFKNFIVDSSSTNHISGNIVISILETREGMMWFGTHEGLNSFNRKTGRFKVYDKSSGLLSPIINSIEEDDRGNLWIGTDKSLTKFNTKNEKFTNYTHRNGLRGVEFSPGASLKSSDGRLFFGCSKGLIFFEPDSVKDEHFVAPVVITDFKIYNQSVPISPDGILTRSIVDAKSLNIPFSSDVITFDFALLDYFNVKKNRFSYKLAGFDNKWNDVGGRNNATYTNLPPGQYTFLVKASSEGVKSEKEASLAIIIIPAYYQTWWFRVLASLGILLTVVLVFTGKTKKITEQNKILENRVAERTEDLDKNIKDLSQEIIERKKAEEKVQASLEEKEVLLKEIHHRVKNNLQVISSLLYLNSRKIEDSESLNVFKDSQNRIKSIALVHERLYQSKDLGKIDFKDYVQRLTGDLFRSFAVNPAMIKLEINIEHESINIDTAVPCGLIINELISNSLKYAFYSYEKLHKEGLIKVHFGRNGNNELTLAVSDNGVGMPEGFTEKKSLSLGLQLVDTLVTQLEGNLEIDLSSGTAFTIKFKDEKNDK